MQFKLNQSSIPAALRVAENSDFALKTPNVLASNIDLRLSIAAIIHVFYPELMPEIAECINNFAYCPELFISTDSIGKAEQIKLFCSKYPDWVVDIRVVENRGRDIAPMIINFQEVFANYEYVLHLHTKKTIHNSAVANWRKYLFYTLCGTKDIVATNLALLSHEKVGFLFAQNINVYRHNLSWGTRFNNVKRLLARSNIHIFNDTLLEFPTSTMFFAKTSALKKLIQQNIQITDFEPENSQITGTLAHDIETSLLYFVEASGYRWIKVSSNHGNILKVNQLNQLDIYLERFVPRLLVRRFEEYKLCTSGVKNHGIVDYFVRKVFNAWQKLLFRCWRINMPINFRVKNIDEL